jgi:hypothetical protein
MANLIIQNVNFIKLLIITQYKHYKYKISNHLNNKTDQLLIKADLYAS